MLKKTFLLIGLSSDPALSLIEGALQKYPQADVLHWNTRNLLNDCVYTLQDGIINGLLFINDQIISLDSINGVFNRMASVELTPEYRSLDEGAPLRQHAVGAAFRLEQWCEIALCPVINRAQANEPNSAKAYQAQVIQHYFHVPDTLLTNDPTHLEDFLTHHEEIIYKSCSGERSIVTKMHVNEFIRKAPQLPQCPVMFQQFIEGQDVRVHVAGDTAIATSVSSGQTDYRYDKAAKWKAFSLAQEIESACIALSEDMDLPLSGIDLRITPDGRVYCFEVNPAPAFSVYEEATGQKISSQIAHWLFEQAV